MEEQHEVGSQTDLSVPARIACTYVCVPEDLVSAACGPALHSLHGGLLLASERILALLQFQTPDIYGKDDADLVVLRREVSVSLHQQLTEKFYYSDGMPIQKTLCEEFSLEESKSLQLRLLLKLGEAADFFIKNSSSFDSVDDALDSYWSLCDPAGIQQRFDENQTCQDELDSAKLNEFGHMFTYNRCLF